MKLRTKNRNKKFFLKIKGIKITNSKSKIMKIIKIKKKLIENLFKEVFAKF